MENEGLDSVQSVKRFPIHAESSIEKRFRLRRYAFMLIALFGSCGVLGWIAFSTLNLGHVSASAKVTPTIQSGATLTATIVIPQVVQKIQTVVIERVVTSVPTQTPVPTQTARIVYKSVVQPTYTPYPTFTPVSQVNGVYFDSQGCLLLSVWNVQAVYVNKTPAVGGERYCDVREFRMVVK